jgi:hypothetical protein
MYGGNIEWVRSCRVLGETIIKIFPDGEVKQERMRHMFAGCHKDGSCLHLPNVRLTLSIVLLATCVSVLPRTRVRFARSTYAR